MRSETDEFNSPINDDTVESFIDGDYAFISTTVSDESLNILLTKDQAREFARQLMEMCGDENE